MNALEGVIVQFVTICRNLRLMRRLIGVPFLFASLYPLSALSAPLTLEQAWEQAEQANPALRSTQAHLARAWLADQGYKD